MTRKILLSIVLAIALLSIEASAKGNSEQISVMNQMFAPAQYGIGADGGWVNYYTYVTTTSTKENRHLYVEIFSESNEQ